MKKDLPDLLKMDQELQGKRCAFCTGSLGSLQCVTYIFFLRRELGCALLPQSQPRIVDATVSSRSALDKPLLGTTFGLTK